MSFALVQAQAGQHRVSKLCQVLRVSRSGYYAWRARRPSPRAQANQALLNEIRQLHQGASRVYGSPRLHQELVARGWACSPNRVARLMRAHQIRAQAGPPRRPAVAQTASTWVAPNVLAGRFQAQRLNQVWLADITYVWTQTGWLYLAVVMDLCSRRIIGWSMSAQPSAQLALDALQMALQRRQPPRQTLLHHSDRGVQYACQTYQECLQAQQIQASMSRRGVCYDNAVVESFFRSLKTERVRSQSYPSQAAARRDLFAYLEIFYNRNRRHSALGYLSPAEFEATLL